MSKGKILTAVSIAVLAAGLLAGTFFDLTLSQSIADVNSAFGLFMEKWGEPPTLIAVAFAFCCSGVYFKKREKSSLYPAILCCICSTISLAATVIRTEKYYSESFAALLPVKLSSVAAAMALTALFWALARKIPYDTLYKMRYACAFAISSALASLVILSALKAGWGRIRFRELIFQGDTGLFMPWYKPHGGGTVDGYKSFPSGHTSNAVLLFSSAYMIKDAVGKKPWKITSALLVLWTLVVMFSRILCGAHFLSDVCAGGLITVVIMLVCKRIFYKTDPLS